MKVILEEISKEKEEEIIVRCHKIDERILSTINRIKNRNDILLGYEKDNIYRIHLDNIYYIEAVDNKVFFYTRDKVYESKQRLYELENQIQGESFFRASKSTLLNVSKIDFIKPSISGRFIACLENNENVVVSRQYVPVLKTMLGI